jgi:hypothetical protein
MIYITIFKYVILRKFGIKNERMCKHLFNNTRQFLKYFKLNMWKWEPEGGKLSGDCFGDKLCPYFYLFANGNLIVVNFLTLGFESH